MGEPEVGVRFLPTGQMEYYDKATGKSLGFAYDASSGASGAPSTQNIAYLSPSQKAAFFAPAVVRQIQDNLDIKLDAKQLAGLTNAVIEEIRSGNNFADIIAGANSSAKIAAAIKAGQAAAEFQSTSGRLIPGTPTAEEAGGVYDPNTGLIKFPDGHYLNAQGDAFDKNGYPIPRQSEGRSASQIGADNASAAANIAQAERYRVQSQIDLENQAKAGTFVPGSNDAYIYLSNGDIKATGALTAKDVADIKESQRLADIRQQEANQTGESQREGNRLRGVEASQTGAYQQGQLGNERLRLSQDAAYQTGQLAQGNERLALDKQEAANRAAATAQQNDLARQKYISEILTRPSDFIASAFGQRGETAPGTRITQADLINQINAGYKANPITFAAPSLSTPANLPIQKYAEGTPAPQQTQPQGRLEDPVVKEQKKKTDSIAKLLQFVEDPDTMHRLVDELAEQRGRLAAVNQPQVPQMAQGGMVNDKVFIAGDPQVPGNPNPEVVHNPTGAPISVTPMNRLQGNIPMYADGTRDARNNVTRYPMHPPVAPDLGAVRGGTFGGEYSRSAPFNTLDEAWVPDASANPGRRLAEGPPSGLGGQRLIPEGDMSGGLAYDANQGFYPKPRPGQPNARIKTPEDLKAAQKSIDTYIKVLRDKTERPKGMPEWAAKAATISTKEGGRVGYDDIVARKILQEHVDILQERIYQADIKNVAGLGKAKNTQTRIPSYRSAVTQELGKLQAGPVVTRQAVNPRLSAFDPRNNPGAPPPPPATNVAPISGDTPTNSVTLDASSLLKRAQAALKTGDEGALKALAESFGRLAKNPGVKLVGRLAGGAGNILGGLGNAMLTEQQLQDRGLKPSINQYAEGTPVTSWVNPADRAFTGMNPQQAADYAYNTPGLSPAVGQTGSYDPTPEARQAGVQQAFGGLQGRWSINSMGAVNWDDPASVKAWDQKRSTLGLANYTPEMFNAQYNAQPAPGATQDQIIAAAEANLPPAIRQLFGGRLQKPFETSGGVLNPENRTGINPLKMGFNLFSPTSLAQLTQRETEALNSYLAAKYNTTLADVVTAMNQTFSSGQRGGGRLVR